MSKSGFKISNGQDVYEILNLENSDAGSLGFKTSDGTDIGNTTSSISADIDTGFKANDIDIGQLRGGTSNYIDEDGRYWQLASCYIDDSNPNLYDIKIHHKKYIDNHDYNYYDFNGICQHHLNDITNVIPIRELKFTVSRSDEHYIYYQDGNSNNGYNSLSYNNSIKHDPIINKQYHDFSIKDFDTNEIIVQSFENTSINNSSFWITHRKDFYNWCEKNKGKYLKIWIHACALSNSKQVRTLILKPSTYNPPNVNNIDVGTIKLVENQYIYLENTEDNSPQLCNLVIADLPDYDFLKLAIEKNTAIRGISTISTKDTDSIKSFYRENYIKNIRVIQVYLKDTETDIINYKIPNYTFAVIWHYSDKWVDESTLTETQKKTTFIPNRDDVMFYTEGMDNTGYDYLLPTVFDSSLTYPNSDTNSLAELGLNSTGLDINLPLIIDSIKIHSFKNKTKLFKEGILINYDIFTDNSYPTKIRNGFINNKCVRGFAYRQGFIRKYQETTSINLDENHFIKIFANTTSTERLRDDTCVFFLFQKNQEEDLNTSAGEALNWLQLESDFTLTDSLYYTNIDIDFCDYDGLCYWSTDPRNVNLLVGKLDHRLLFKDSVLLDTEITDADSYKDINQYLIDFLNGVLVGNCSLKTSNINLLLPAYINAQKDLLFNYSTNIIALNNKYKYISIEELSYLSGLDIELRYLLTRPISLTTSIKNSSFITSIEKFSNNFKISIAPISVTPLYAYINETINLSKVQLITPAYYQGIHTHIEGTNTNSNVEDIWNKLFEFGSTSLTSNSLYRYPALSKYDYVQITKNKSYDRTGYYQELSDTETVVLENIFINDGYSKNIYKNKYIALTDEYVPVSQEYILNKYNNINDDIKQLFIGNFSTYTLDLENIDPEYTLHDHYKSVLSRYLLNTSSDIPANLTVKNYLKVFKIKIEEVPEEYTYEIRNYSSYINIPLLETLKPTDNTDNVKQLFTGITKNKLIYFTITDRVKSISITGSDGSSIYYANVDDIYKSFIVPSSNISPISIRSINKQFYNINYEDFDFNTWTGLIKPWDQSDYLTTSLLEGSSADILVASSRDDYVISKAYMKTATTDYVEKEFTTETNPYDSTKKYIKIPIVMPEEDIWFKFEFSPKESPEDILYTLNILYSDGNYSVVVPYNITRANISTNPIVVESSDIADMFVEQGATGVDGLDFFESTSDTVGVHINIDTSGMSLKIYYSVVPDILSTSVNGTVECSIIT